MIRIAGKKGETVCYSIPALEITETTDGINLKWAAFRFYTPEGNLVDEGYKYFEVEALNETLYRETIAKEFKILIKTGGIYLIEKYLGTQEIEPIIIEGLEGDIVLTGIIPANQAETISIEYKEVFNG